MSFLLISLLEWLLFFSGLFCPEFVCARVTYSIIPSGGCCLGEGQKCLLDTFRVCARPCGTFLIAQKWERSLLRATGSSLLMFGICVIPWRPGPLWETFNAFFNTRMNFARLCFEELRGKNQSDLLGQAQVWQCVQKTTVSGSDCLSSPQILFLQASGGKFAPASIWFVRVRWCLRRMFLREAHFNTWWIFWHRE
jgi:hypothetical protein